MRGKKRGAAGGVSAPPMPPAFHHIEAGKGAKIAELHVHPLGNQRVRLGVHYRDDWVAIAIHQEITIDEARALRDVLDAIVTHQKEEKT
jgi:hypothetical protein